MEPILQNPLFTSILRVWKFFTTYHDYLGLPETFGQVSLYQFDQHVQNEKFKSSFMSQLMESLVRKASGSQRNKRHEPTALYLAKQNKFKIFESLVKTSAYQLGLSQVQFALAWREIPIISTAPSFQKLSNEQKYKYLSLLVDHVSSSSNFKRNHMQSLKVRYAQATQVEGKNLLQIQKQFIPKMFCSIFLGKDSTNKCYVYVSKIGDSVMECDLKTNKWRRIQGQQSLKKQVLSKLIEKQNSISNEQLDLLEQISDIWIRLKWNIKCNAFDKTQKLFKLKQQNQIPNKLQIIKQKLHSLDIQYTKFVSDCFNYRWGSKQRRIKFHQQIDQANNLNDLVICLSKFFSETRHTSHKKLKTLDFYDYDLKTKDVSPDEFKSVFLHGNYLYCKSVLSESHGSQKHHITLYQHITQFLNNQPKFEPYLFEFMMIFVESMLGITAQLYPSQYKKRLTTIQRMQNQMQSKKQRQEEEAKNKNNLGKNKLKRHNQNKMDNSEDGNSQQDDGDSQQQSNTTAQQTNEPIYGRRLRQKVKISYKIQYNSNSNARKKKVNKPNKPVVNPSRKQPSRNAKSKMNIDSDTEEDQDESLSLSDSDEGSQKQQKSKGLNLDNYKFKADGEQVIFRRSLRNSTDHNKK